jgi:hypothetical protein
MRYPVESPVDIDEEKFTSTEAMIDDPGAAVTPARVPAPPPI